MPNSLRVYIKLFITGQTIRSQRAVANLQRICMDRLGDDCQVDIIDVLLDPEAAEQAKILATPTLIKVRPLPQRRIIGDLSMVDDVLRALELDVPD